MSVPVGDVDFAPISSLAAAFNREDTVDEKEVLLDHKEELATNDVDDLLDIDWSHTDKVEAVVEPPKSKPQPSQQIDDDLLGVDFIEETKPVQPVQQQQQSKAHEDFDLFGDVEERFESPNRVQHPETEDLLGVHDDIVIKPAPTVEQVVPQQQPVQTSSTANPYAFLDNVHTLDTLKAMKNDIALGHDDEDDFVESDVTFAEPTKIHAFESSDLIIQYSSTQVSSTAKRDSIAH